MKIFLFIILFALIITDNPLLILSKERKRKNLLRLQKIKECVKEKGSQSFKKLISKFENKNMTLGKIIKLNEDYISKDDLKIFNNCRKQIYLQYKKKNIIKIKRP